MRFDPLRFCSPPWKCLNKAYPGDHSLPLSCSGGPCCWPHKWVSPLVKLLRWGLVVGFGRDDDGVLVHQLAGGVGEGGERKSDAMHLSLANALVMLFLKITTPARQTTKSVMIHGSHDLNHVLYNHNYITKKHKIQNLNLGSVSFMLLSWSFI